MIHCLENDTYEFKIRDYFSNKVIYESGKG